MPGYWSCYGREEIVAWYPSRSIDRHTSMFDLVFFLHILQKCLLVLGSIRCLVLRNNIQFVVLLQKPSQLPLRIKDMRRKSSIPIIGVTSVQYLDIFCHTNFTAKHKSSFHSVILATACITPSMWLNMSLETAITWCNVTICLFDIHRVQDWNGLKTSITCLTMVDLSWVVKSGQ